LFLILKGHRKLPKKINLYILQKRLGYTSPQILRVRIHNLIDEVKNRIRQYKASILENYASF